LTDAESGWFPDARHVMRQNTCPLTSVKPVADVSVRQLLLPWRSTWTFGKGVARPTPVGSTPTVVTCTTRFEGSSTCGGLGATAPLTFVPVKRLTSSVRFVFFSSPLRKKIKGVVSAKSGARQARMR